MRHIAISILQSLHASSCGISYCGYAAMVTLHCTGDFFILSESTVSVTRHSIYYALVLSHYGNNLRSCCHHGTQSDRQLYDYGRRCSWLPVILPRFISFLSPCDISRSGSCMLSGRGSVLRSSRLPAGFYHQGLDAGAIAGIVLIVISVLVLNLFQRRYFTEYLAEVFLF